jgi:hypothetical protein
MPPRPARLALLAAALTGVAVASRADPRWWWDDVRLTATPTDGITPHICVPGYASGGAGANGVFITWAEVDPVGGDLEIWMTASFNTGCTFCAPIRLTDNAVDDTHPRIAVLRIPSTGMWSIAVTFESAGQVVIAWDATTADSRVPFDQLCAELADVGPTIIANDQYVRFGGGAVVAEHPGICGASTPAFGHFHAAWREQDPVNGGRIRYAHDLMALGGPGWTQDPVKTLAPASPVDDVLDPVIACDVATDPDPISGNPTADRTATNVAFVDLAPTDETRIVGLRSVDSGRTFSPQGLRADAPAGPVSDPSGGPASPISHPALDSATNSFRTDRPAWLMTAFDDARVLPDAVRCDARYIEDAVNPNPDWQDPDENVTTVSTPGDGEPAVTLVYSMDRATPAWIAWQDSRFGAREIAYRAGMLDHLAPDVIDLTRFPYAPVRPLDSAVSEDRQLSHCVFDAATFDCPPTRTTGDALDVELDANEFGIYAVWSDSRDGNREIYFKRTDRFVSNQPPRLTAGCGPLGDAWVDVEFDLVDTCTSALSSEKMGRYLIYYGTNPGGPFMNAAAPIGVIHDLAGPSPVTRRITGLVPGTTYQVIVVPEDQARNVWPASFDPTADAAAAHPNERSILTPDPCAPVPICLWRSDVTSVYPHVPARNVVYLWPPDPEDISLQGPAYQCPFANGDLEPDARALANGIPLVLYQVNRAIGSLRLAKSGTTIRLTF